MRKFALVIMTILLMISIVACGTGSDLPDMEEGSLTENSMQDTERIEPDSDGGAEENGSMPPIQADRDRQGL